MTRELRWRKQVSDDDTEDDDEVSLSVYVEKDGEPEALSVRV